ncbi:unnamed protein product [Bathycoccus prasinos]
MPILTIKRRRISSSSGREKYIGSHTRSETMIQTTSFASSSSSSLRCCNCCFYHHHRWTEKFLKRRGLRKTPLVRSRAKEEEEDDSDATTKTTSGEETRTPVSLAKLNTSPRRIVLAMTSTTALALGANFLGITSLFLRVNEPLARKLKLDTVYEVSGYRRDRNDEKGYEFLFPNEYLADQTIARRNAMRKAQTLDLPSLRDTKGQKNVGEPESAFGPMGTNGEENMSVIVQTSTKGFDLGQFGDAEEQASWLLENALARPGSGKEAKLFSASETIGEDGIKYYQFEYTIKTANWYRRNVAVFAQNKKTGDVYTFVAQCPVERWDGMGEKFRKSANSFRVFTPKPPSF